MTFKEFDNTRFSIKTLCIYKEKEYPIVSVDFEERLIAIYETPAMEYEDNYFPDWKRCENVTILQQE